MIEEEKRNTVGATIFAVLLGMSVLCFAAWAILAPEEPEPYIIGTPVVAEDSALIQLEATDSEEDATNSEYFEQLVEENEGMKQSRLAAMEKALVAEQELARLKEKFGFSQAQADEPIDYETRFLALERSARNTEKSLNSEISSLTERLQELEAEAEESEKVAAEAASAAEQSVAKANELATQLATVTVAKEAAENQLAAAEKKAAAFKPGQMKNLRDQIAELKGKLEESDNARELLTSEKNQLTQSLKEAETKRAKAASDELAKLKQAQAKLVSEKNAKIADLEKQLKALNEKEAQMASASSSELPTLDLPLLVNSPDQLAGYAKPLFSRLGKIEESVESREKIYAEIIESGKYAPQLNVLFGSGDSSVDKKYDADIAELVEKAEDSEKFLVVGYASTDGTTEANRELSSKRASAVAQEISKKVGEGGGDRVQAIYFGQTERFDQASKSPNRVVEIWRIK